MMMSGCLMAQFLQSFIMDDTQDYDLRFWSWKFYGSAFRASYTMFEITLSGCWPNYVRTLVEHVSPLFGIFFMLYVSVVVFAIIRIITAIFLRETLQAATQDADELAQEQLKKKGALVAKLREFFQAADVSGNGTVSMEELTAILANAKARSWLQG